MSTSLKNISILLALAVLLNSCGEKKNEDAPKSIPKVSIKTLNAEAQPEVFSYSGTIEADNTVSLGFSVSGRVNSVTIEEGQRVNKGQLLATIETEEYQNAYTIAKAGLDLAVDNFKRLDLLYAKGSLPQRDHINAKIAMEQAKANSGSALKRLKDTKIYAPFSGIITAKLIERGASVAPGIPSFTIMKTDKVYAKASINENEIANIKIGIPAKVKIASIDQTFDGKVTIINPSADAATRTFDVKVLLNNTKGTLLPGMISDIKIQTGKMIQAITIPASAVIRDADDINYVFVASKKQAIRKRVNLGSFKAEEVIVTKGLEEGENVIISGQRNLKDGQEISF
ncbi:efflux RND transporter periplasmic adaptor subunit [Flavobacterium sp. LHD-85]|uniref:efflux RND transporter periplasmic adaptor subunit n=1 Tax=Flavobacterium sp. LHD-85 TaxID=3071410 RepID=UPI0027DFED95|nr:efflux RND transporter periplasmic adaptor subunit [Flavobacterium sp. LHD-85]MDQ6530972.1 efflux RND transporter periplasmic adaptor subunit [Flavobacterium sp. LHD-85]